jgi:arsenite methyltransferase
MSMTQASNAYFDRVAGQWDSIRAGYFTEAVRDAAIAKAYLRPEMSVADVGSGTGFIAAGLAPLVRKVYVLDGSAAMLDVARKNLAAFTNVEFLPGEAQSLPLPDASVDAAFANMYLHHCPDPLAAIREMVRILKPGGRLVITDMDAHPYTWLKEEMADEWMGFERDALRAWFKQADLVNTIVDCTGQCCSASTQASTVTDEQGRTANISIFLATATRRVKMVGAVRETYSAAATAGTGCGCTSNSTAEAASGAAASASSCCSSESQASASAPAAASSCCSSGAQASASAPAAASSCCSGQAAEPAHESEFGARYYSPDELSAVPPEAGEISLGCGNPIALAALRPGEVVLDIGSGGGMDSFLAAGRVGPSGRVIGVDMTPAMLERATRSAEKAGITNVEFRFGQAESLPTGDATVDVVLSNCVINLTEDKGLVFREAFRVLKPGGRLEVSDVVAAGPMPLEVRQDAGEWAGCVSGALPEREYLDLIEQAGFSAPAVRRSASTDQLAGVQLYSAIVSARKP